MGKASRRKWEARIKAAVADATSKPKKDSPWYASISLQLGIAILLTVGGAMLKDSRWLLWVAWVFFWPTVWRISNKVSSFPRVTCSVGIILVCLCLYAMNVALEPKNELNKPQERTADRPIFPSPAEFARDVAKLLSEQIQKASPPQPSSKAQEAMLRPIIFTSFYHNETGAGWKLVNSGPGTAITKWFQVLVDGKPQRHWGEVVQLLGMTGDISFTNPRRGVPIKPSEVTLLWQKPPLPIDFNQQTVDRVRIEICYCSLNEECWLTINDEPTKKNSCTPEPKVIFPSPPT